MRSTYKILNDEGLHFITSTIVNWIPIFRDDKYTEILIDCIRFCQKQKGLKVHAYVIMENHFHMVVSGINIKSIIQSLKGYSARKIVEELERSNEKKILFNLKSAKLSHKIKSNYQVWQEGYHPQLITTTYMLQQKVDYIHSNPVKHLLVKEPNEWKYSSLHYYSGEPSVIDIDELNFW